MPTLISAQRCQCRRRRRHLDKSASIRHFADQPGWSGRPAGFPQACQPPGHLALRLEPGWVYRRPRSENSQNRATSPIPIGDVDVQLHAEYDAASPQQRPDTHPLPAVGMPGHLLHVRRGVAAARRCCGKRTFRRLKLPGFAWAEINCGRDMEAWELAPRGRDPRPQSPLQRRRIQSIPSRA